MSEMMFGPGHNQPPRDLPEVRPDWFDGVTALISRREFPAMTSKRTGARPWILRFERRTPPFMEPLMGWTGGDDTLVQVELTFATRQEAIEYAEREGLAYRVEGEDYPAPPGTASDQQRKNRSADQARWENAVGAVVWLTSLQAAYGRCHLSGLPDLDRALLAPASVFATPDEVVRHPLLSLDCKREILWRWAWDEYLIELAQDEGMPEGPPSRLDEVKAALLRLGDEWHPHPAAPAAFAVRYDVDRQLSLAA